MERVYEKLQYRTKHQQSFTSVEHKLFVSVVVAFREQLIDSVGNKREAARADCADHSVSCCPDASIVFVQVQVALFKIAVVAQQCTSVRLIKVD